MMHDQWVSLPGDSRGSGYCAPNTEVYPWQWLWDSCFHVLIWAELGHPDRALAELEQVFTAQAADGFVPHMNYQLDPAASVEFWGREASSNITQPPMYGHAAAELIRHGVDVPDTVVDQSIAGLRFLLDHRARSTEDLVLLCHPWESGTDDSPRWDDACPGEGFDLATWRTHKSDLVAEVRAANPESSSPVQNPSFEVASIGFNALLAFNTIELAEVSSRPGLSDLRTKADQLVAAIDARWNGETWVDGGSSTPTSRAARTVDGLLPVLVTRDSRAVEIAFGSLIDERAYGGPYGPAGVHREEPSYDADTYWRGPAWPQLSYLLMIAAQRRGSGEVASSVATSLRDGAAISGLAEYWNIDSGAGLGARPQSWAGLGILAG